MYYYFKKNKIKGFQFEINCDINNSYTPLTEEQKDFYEENPNASYSEVLNCKLNEILTVIERPIEELRDLAKKEISEYSSSVMSKFVTDLQLANALVSIELRNKSGITDTIYDYDLAEETINKFNVIGNQCRTKYYQTMDLIDICDTSEEIDDVVNEAKNYYDGIEY